jgi:hypothetical protein
MGALTVPEWPVAHEVKVVQVAQVELVAVEPVVLEVLEVWLEHLVLELVDLLGNFLGKGCNWGC